jgi:hypothetical protein
MLVNEWVDTVWNVVNVRPKTLHDYKRLYKRHLMPVIGSMSLDEVDVVVLQRKLISLPPQTARHCLMLVKTIDRSGLTWKSC